MRAAGVAALLGIFLFTFMSCKSPSGPDDLTADVTVNNGCGVAADVFMDGTFKVSVENGSNKVIGDVTKGVHLFEAKKAGTAMLVFSGTLDIDPSYNYVLVIEGPSTIVVNNKYGETLQITMDGTVLGDLEDESSKTISKVTLGVHSLKAAKKSDSTVVASTSIDVNEVKEYTWTIAK